MPNIIYKNSKVKTEGVMINWPSVGTTYLHAGTPLSVSGEIANNDSAFGILINDVCKTSYQQECNVIVSGTLDLPAVQENFGARLTSACKDALRNITFIQMDGKPYVPVVGLPAVTSSDNGKIPMVVKGKWALVDLKTVLASLADPTGASTADKKVKETI